MFSKILKQFSFDTGITQKDVAKRLKYSPQRVNNYYRDIADPPFEFLELFRNEFQIDLRKLADKEARANSAGISSYNPIPVYDLELKNNEALDFFNHSELVIFYVDVPFFSDCFAAVRVSGNDMIPALMPGDLAMIKKVQDYDSVPYGSPLLIVTEEQRFIRYIRKADDEKNSFLLKASDPNIDDQSIKKKSIKYLFQIKGKMNRF